jgi:hypothetical protein
MMTKQSSSRVPIRNIQLNVLKQSPLDQESPTKKGKKRNFSPQQMIKAKNMTVVMTQVKGDQGLDDVIS